MMVEKEPEFSRAVAIADLAEADRGEAPLEESGGGLR